jgi:hypothetical protein
MSLFGNLFGGPAPEEDVMGQPPPAQPPPPEPPTSLVGSPPPTKRPKRSSTPTPKQQELDEQRRLQEQHREELTRKDKDNRTCKIIDHSHFPETIGDGGLDSNGYVIFENIEQLKSHTSRWHNNVLGNFNEETLSYIPGLIVRSPLDETFINSFGPEDAFSYLLSFIKRTPTLQDPIAPSDAITRIGDQIVKRNLFTFGAYSADTQWGSPTFNEDQKCFICDKLIIKGTQEREHLIPSSLSFFLFGVSVGDQANAANRLGGGNLHEDFKKWLKRKIVGDGDASYVNEILKSFVERNNERINVQKNNFRWAHKLCNIQKLAKVIPKCFTLNPKIGVDLIKFNKIKDNITTPADTCWHTDYITKPDILRTTFSELFKTMTQHGLDGENINNIIKNNLKFVTCLSYFLVWMEGGIRYERDLVLGFKRIIDETPTPQPQPPPVDLITAGSQNGGGELELTLEDVKNIMRYLDIVSGIQEYNPNPERTKYIKSLTPNKSKDTTQRNPKPYRPHQKRQGPLPNYNGFFIPPIVAGGFGGKHKKTSRRKRTYRKKKGIKHNVQSVQSKKSTFRKRKYSKHS